MEENKIDRRKITLIILGVAILIVLVVGITYAFFQNQIGEPATGNVNVATDTPDNLQFNVSNDISININQFNFGPDAGNQSDDATATATLLANSTNDTAEYTYYVYFNIKSNNYTYTTDDYKPEIVLTITDPEGNPVTKLANNNLEYVEAENADGTITKGFDITTASGLINIASNYEITSSSSTDATEQDWIFTVTFINLDTNQAANGESTLDAEIILSKDVTNYHEICEPGTMACDIARLYNEENPEINGLYYHDGTYTNEYCMFEGNQVLSFPDGAPSTNAEDYSYRYAGANPNNYVCFGSDEETCPAENLYRIIGVFNGQIKLIKADYTTSDMLGTDGRDYYGAYPYSTSNYKGSMDTSTIAGYRWNYDTSVSTYGSNNWTTSEFNTINLNTNYWNYLGSTWQNLIAETTWHLGGMTSNGNTAKVFYDGERNNAGYGSNPTTYTDEIGLMYPSDYGYAASPDAWATNLGSYDNSTITANNWLYMGLYEWTITPNSSRSNYACYVDFNGRLNYGNASSSNSARPVFYLESNVELSGGTGTSSDPYRLAD